MKFVKFLVGLFLLAGCGQAVPKAISETTSGSRSEVSGEDWASVLSYSFNEHEQVAVPDPTWAKLVVKNTGTKSWNQNEISLICEATSGNWTFRPTTLELKDENFVNRLNWPVQPGQTVGLVQVLVPEDVQPRDQLVPVRYVCQLSRNSVKFGGASNEISFRLVKNSPPPPKCEAGPITSPPPSELELLRQIRDQNPGMINDCTGHPVVTHFLDKVVRELQKKDCRWGFFRKPDARIPRDILVYAKGTVMQGSNDLYIWDIVSSGCNNTPWDPNFADPQPNANVWWDLLNPDGAPVNNGVWTYDPY